MNVPNPTQLSERLTKQQGFAAYRPVRGFEQVERAQQALIEAFGSTALRPLDLNRWKLQQVSRHEAVDLMQTWYAKKAGRLAMGGRLLEQGIRPVVPRDAVDGVVEAMNGQTQWSAAMLAKATGGRYHTKLVPGGNYAAVVTLPLELSNSAVHDRKHVATFVTNYTVEHDEAGNRLATSAKYPEYHLPLVKHEVPLAGICDVELFDEIDGLLFSSGVELELQPLRFER